jgi:hypothetical protein
MLDVVVAITGSDLMCLQLANRKYICWFQSARSCALPYAFPPAFSPRSQQRPLRVVLQPRLKRQIGRYPIVVLRMGRQSLTTVRIR